jgi:hypothetical protein
MNNEIIHTPENSGSGQIGRCIKCKKLPTKEGHDGCLGTLPDDTIMNACCGHGQDDMAYIQYAKDNEKEKQIKRISGKEAINEQLRLIKLVL